MSFSCYFLGNAVFTNLSVNILKAFFRYPAVNLPREFKERKVPQQPQNSKCGKITLLNIQFIATASKNCKNFQMLFDLFFEIILFTEFNVTGMCISNSLLLDAINYNGLVYFLLANVTTGIINLSFHTIQASATTSVVILVLYIIFISYVVFFIKVRKSFHS